MDPQDTETPPRTWRNERSLEEWLYDNVAAVGRQLGLEISQVARESRSGDRVWDIIVWAEGHGKVILETKTRANQLPSGMAAQGRDDDAMTFVWVTPEFQARDLAQVKQQGSAHRQLMEVVAIELGLEIKDGLLVPVTRVCAPSNAIVRRLVRAGHDFADVWHEPIRP